MKLKFKINLKKSKIPEWIKVPKTLIEGKPWKSKLINFVEKQYLKETFNFAYDKKTKVLKSTDRHPKVIHGIYSPLNLKLAKEIHKGMYAHDWFTGFKGRFVGHDYLFRHFITFDEVTYTLTNKVVYFYKKDGRKNFISPGKDVDSGACVWMDVI
jgi:hypothetical protein